MTEDTKVTQLGRSRCDIIFIFPEDGSASAALK